MQIEKIKELAAKAKQHATKNLNEDQTKNALILPFIKALGYDIHDPFEVTPELVADVGKKNREKIDYAILKDNKPVILIEAKAAGATLNKEMCAQFAALFRGPYIRPYRNPDEWGTISDIFRHP